MTDELDDLLMGPEDTSMEASDTAAPASESPADSHAADSHASDSHAADFHASDSHAAEVHSEPVRAETAEHVESPPAPAAEEAEPEPKPKKPRVPRPPVEEASLEKPPIKLDWYILKVQSNREDSIADALKRRIAIEGLGDYFDEIIVPTEKVSEFKGGKKRVVKRKIYPGYIVVHMDLNDDTWFLVRETPGIGDFTGSGGKPTPMLPHEVSKIVSKQEEKAEEEIRTVIPYSQGDRVRIKEGTFENFEGDVDNIDKANGRVTIMINIFGRSTPVELEYWQVEKL